MPWKWLTFICGAVLMVGAGWLLVEQRRKEPAPVAPPSRPNIVLISLDTLRPDHLGCFGYTRKTTPNLDDFARQSIVFTNCRAQAPWTLPSHMALLTSMLPAHNGVDNINKVLPAEVPTLAEILHDGGYRTAGLVNNAQMRRHWGFARGFDTWREFEADTPAGQCDNITAEALAWFKSTAEGSPFFLFLHYYDPHDPYAAPESYRRSMGTSLTGPEARQLCFQHRFPGRDFADQATLADLISAYDAEISWLDHELGKLLGALPRNTLVVIFSDHGEAFKEHGWMLHGATLYEEEIRVPLIIRLAGATPTAATINESVMLMDVALTILGQCGMQPPVEFQGLDLAPLWQGQQLPQRLVPSESKAVLEGQYSLSVVLYPLKGTYSLFDGRFQCYKLPDEHKPLGEVDQAAADALFKPLRGWMEMEQYWMVHATGQGDYEAMIELSKGSFGLYIRVGFDPMRDSFEVLDEGRALRWHVYPGGGRKALFLQPADPEATLRADFKVNGMRSKDLVFIGKDQHHPETLPADIPVDVAPVSPVIEKPFSAERAGFYVFRHRAPGGRSRPARVEPLDEQTIKQLRSLGYVR